MAVVCVCVCVCVCVWGGGGGVGGGGGGGWGGVGHYVQSIPHYHHHHLLSAFPFLYITKILITEVKTSNVGNFE